MEGISFDYELLSDKEIRDHIRNCEGKHVQQVAFSTYMDCVTQICFTEQKIRSGITWNGAVSTKQNNKSNNKSTTEIRDILTFLKGVKESDYDDWTDYINDLEQMVKSDYLRGRLDARLTQTGEWVREFDEHVEDMSEFFGSINIKDL